MNSSSMFKFVQNPVDAFLFQPPTPPSYTFEDTGLLHEKCKIVTTAAPADFAVVTMPEARPACFVWVHGNASDCGQESAGFVQISNALNVTIVGVEFPGYGCFPGTPTEESIDRCVRGGYNYARSKGFKKIYLVARSLGCGPAVRLARKLFVEGDAHDLQGLVLWSSIVSVRDSCANLAGSLVSKLVKADRWSPVEDLAFVECSVLFITGEKDSLTTLKMCARLRKSCTKAPYTFQHTSETADHNCGWDLDFDILQPLKRFMDFTPPAPDPLVVVEYDVVAMGDIKAALPLLVPDMGDSAEICIVGCGPVGLWTACNLVHLGIDPLKILCLDKYETFQRSHVLRLESASLDSAPESLRRLVEPLVGVTRTNTLEALLAEEARSKGVRFRRPFEVRDLDNTDGPLRTCRVLVACDGAHSVVREQVFGGIERKVTVEYVLDVRADIVNTDSQTRPEKIAFAQMVAMLGSLSHICEESVGKTPTGKLWPVTMRLLITSSEIAAIRTSGFGTARSPLLFTPEYASLLPTEVRRTIDRWVETRGRLYPAERMRNIKCVAIDLNCYRAKRFACAWQGEEEEHTQQERCALLVGDSAFGVPFFRALNNGMMCGTEAALCIKEELEGRAPLGGERNRQDLARVKGSTVVVEGISTPIERDGFAGKSFGASLASMNITSQVSQIMAHASFEQGTSMLMKNKTQADPLRRYDEYVRKLARREFAVAQNKRDGLEITKFANFMQNQAQTAVAIAMEVMNTSTSSMTSSNV